MLKKHFKKIMAIGIFVILSQFVFGQVTFETKVTSYGFMGMGAFESNTKTYLLDDAQRTETDLKFTGKVLKYMSPKGTEVSIVRLDKGLIWNVDNAKKTYREQTFAEIKEMMTQGGEYQTQEMPEQDEDYESEYDWQKPIVKVENLKETKTINGFNCQHYLVSVTTVGVHKETGTKDTMLFVSDIWNAKDISEKMTLVNDFNIKYMKAMGLDVLENQGLAMITGMYKEQMETLEDEAGKLKGYPIVNDMKLTMTKNAIPTKEEETGDESVSLRDIQRDFGGLLGKKLLKESTKKKKEEKKSTTTQLFHMKTEVKNINSNGIADGMFEVKKGYKLKKN
jgi:hypothetical protein